MGCNADPLYPYPRREYRLWIWHRFESLRLSQRQKPLLEADFPGIEVLPVDAFPQGNGVIGSEETAALVKASGVDAVIIGNAA